MTFIITLKNKSLNGLIWSSSLTMFVYADMNCHTDNYSNKKYSQNHYQKYKK